MKDNTAKLLNAYREMVETNTLLIQSLSRRVDAIGGKVNEMENELDHVRACHRSLMERIKEDCL